MCRWKKSLVHDWKSENEIYEKAEKVFETLSGKLEKQLYFLSHTPSSADAMIFGYLAAIIYLDLPNRKLGRVLLQKKFENLKRFVDYIFAEHFGITASTDLLDVEIIDYPIHRDDLGNVVDRSFWAKAGEIIYYSAFVVGGMFFLMQLAAMRKSEAEE